MCAAGLLLTSCADETVEPIDTTVNQAEGLTTVKLVVPSNSSFVKVVYPTADGTNTVNVPVSLDGNYSERYGVSAITTGAITLASPVSTTVNIYDEQGNKLALNVPVAATEGNATGVTMLPEDAVANYVDSDANQLDISGTSMFFQYLATISHYIGRKLSFFSIS